MKFSDLKYLLGYTIPVCLFFSLTGHSWWLWLSPFVAFGIIPVLEMQFKGHTDNLDDEEKDKVAGHLFFNALLYLNLPIIYVLLYLSFQLIQSNSLNAFETTGLVFSLGILLASNGINVAHELGHKQSNLAWLTSKLLLTPCLYNHFTIEHNRGHHLHVGTPMDPATAREGESVYAFWIRSTLESYKDAWKLEEVRISKVSGWKRFLKNEMILNLGLTLLYITIVGLVFGVFVMMCAILAGIISFLFLETINYIEHYGLTRRITETGKYERVEAQHSWNSNHSIGRLILYELTRHSDHHYKANKEYQLLDHHDASPQLPLGYPASMLLALLPPLWFATMDKELQKYNSLAIGSK